MLKVPTNIKNVDKYMFTKTLQKMIGKKKYFMAL